MKKSLFFTGILCALLSCSKDKGLSNDNTNGKVTASSSKEGSLTPDKVIHISGSTFSPDSLEMNVNNTVVWVNDDNITHNVSFNEVNSDVAPGSSFRFYFDNTGTYHYFCKYHGEKGTLVVAGIR
ncbi:MAG TPA: cupredoxin domain-containing protein [Chitinophagaceae bacterium]|nr:cupredoxin domain-containing protein [Chitinophagaceae bacterium]